MVGTLNHGGCYNKGVSRLEGHAMRSSKALIAIAALLWAGAASGKELVSADVYSVDHPTVRATAYLGELIEERTAGRHKIASLGEGSTNSEAFAIATVRNGTLDMARVNLASFCNLVPSAIVPALPYLFTSTAHMRRVLDGPIGEELLAELDRQGVVGLCFYDTGTRSFYGSKPIRKASDLAGLKVRVPQSGPWVAIMQAMGVQPMPMPYERVSVGLRNGTIALAENNWPSFVSSRHYEVAKYFSMTRHSMTPGVLIVSRQTWDGFSKEDQAIVRAAARESVDYIRKLWDENELTASKVSKVLNVEIVSDVDQASFIDAVAPVRDRQIANPKAQDMIRRIASTP